MSTRHLHVRMALAKNARKTQWTKSTSVNAHQTTMSVSHSTVHLVMWLASSPKSKVNLKTTLINSLIKNKSMRMKETFVEHVSTLNLNRTMNRKIRAIWLKST